MIDTRYGDGTSQTTTRGLSYGEGGDDLSALLRGLVMRRYAPKPGASGAGRNTTVAAPQRIMHTGDIRGGDRGPSWQAVQGSATRPVGLGPGMIPGMGVDPRLLPPGMRPSASGLVIDPDEAAQAEVRAQAELDSQRRIALNRARGY